MIRQKPRKRFVKAHVFVGTVTKVITAAEATDGSEGDCDYLEGLLNETAALGYTIERVSADKGYLSKGNLEAIAARGAVPYVPFKVKDHEVKVASDLVLRKN